MQKKKTFLKELSENIRKKEGSLKDSEKRLFYTLAFLLRFMMLALPLYLLIWSRASLYSLERAEAEQVISLLNIFQTGAELKEDYGMPVIKVASLKKHIGIDAACTGYSSMLAFAALVTALPNIKWKKRLKGFLVGLPILYVANLARITTTILLGVRFGEKVLDIAHTLLWRQGLILVVLITWGAWLKLSIKKIDYKVFI